MTILISKTIFFAYAQLQNSVNKKGTSFRHQKRQIDEVSTNRLLDVCEILLSFSKYFLSKNFVTKIKYYRVKFSLLLGIC